MERDGLTSLSLPEPQGVSIAVIRANLFFVFFVFFVVKFSSADLRPRSGMVFGFVKDFSGSLDKAASSRRNPRTQAPQLIYCLLPTAYCLKISLDGIEKNPYTPADDP